MREAKRGEAHYAKLEQGLRQARPATGGAHKSLGAPAGGALGPLPKSGNPKPKSASALKAWSTDDAVPRAR